MCKLAQGLAELEVVKEVINDLGEGSKDMKLKCPASPSDNPDNLDLLQRVLKNANIPEIIEVCRLIFYYFFL